MPKSKHKNLEGDTLQILSESSSPLQEILLKNRGITEKEHDLFFHPTISDLHDPTLMPDMDAAVTRIGEARTTGERVVIFGDYDVDGVSSTALLFRFFQEIGIECSYRLPHRVHDGYGLKKYFFDELKTKNVKLVITVDCGTRDIDVIEYAKSLGIDVIITDHHAVPEYIPAGVPVINPKRKDSKYRFSSLAGAGVAFKLVHALLIEIYKDTPDRVFRELEKYTDIASLGTVADCMPLVGENRIITTLGLHQMKQSQSSALRKYIEQLDRDIDGEADIIGFQIGPRINAAGRMDSPLKALHWLLADDEHVDSWYEEIESLNTKRQERVKFFIEDALSTIDTNSPILFYSHQELEHGLIGLVAGKLTETYAKPAIVLCHHQETPEQKKRREYEHDGKNQNTINVGDTLVASCRSPEWCNLVGLLDACQSYFVRYGGHRQAAGFTIATDRFDEFQAAILHEFENIYGTTENLPKKTINVECILDPKDITLKTLDTLDMFRPFGIGNPKPLFLLKNITITECSPLGKSGAHLSLRCAESPNIRYIYWGGVIKQSYLAIGSIVSFCVSLERNEWNGTIFPQVIVHDIIEEGIS